MYKTEMHLHTSESSFCAHRTAAEMVRAYKDAGYSTVVVTDHMQWDTVGAMPGDWRQKLDFFFAGYEAAKREGEALGVNVLFGAEFGFWGSPNHYLVYGMDREFLEAHPNILDYGIEKLSTIVRREGMLILQAHPFRDGSCYPTPYVVDGVEVCNTNPRHDDKDEKAWAMAREYNLLISGGSDAHREDDAARGGIETEEEIKTIGDLIAAIRSGKVRILGEAV